jgi:transposase
VEDWAEIRRLHRAEGLPIKAIARVLGVSRNTVRAAIASDAPPKYQRTPAGSIVDEVELRIRELLQAYPRMPATVIAERIGWTRGLTVFKERVAELRPLYLPPDPAGRTTYVVRCIETRSAIRPCRVRGACCRRRNAQPTGIPRGRS